MAPTSKAASNTYSSAIYSHKERLGMPINGLLKDLKGEKLDYFQK